MLTALKRIFPLIAILLIIAACGAGDSAQPTGAILADTPATPAPEKPIQPLRARNRMSDSMLAQILGYYNALYGNDSVYMSISRSDTLVELSFSDASGGPDSYSGILFLANISLVTAGTEILNGDLNGDGLDDMLVSIHTEGGGGGGNAWWNDHFVFIATPDGQHTLADTKSDGELVGSAGYFFPDTIANGIISGVSNEYAEDDGHCCPSRYYRMKIRLDKDQLSQVGKSAIPKPKGFE